MLETTYKLVISGQLLEFYHYDNPVFYGPRPEEWIKKRNNPYESEEPEVYEDKQVETSGGRDLSSVYRAKRNLRRIIGCNSFAWKQENGKPYLPIFFTLTFKDNITDLTTAHKIFTKYNKRFNYFVFENKKANLKYTSVPEFQKRGAVHYHVLMFNLPFVVNLYDKLERVWGQGYTNVKSVDNVDGAIRYLSKYIAKSLDDERLLNRKRYFASRDLYKPVVLHNNEAVEEILKVISVNIKENYRYRMAQVPWCGGIDYTRFILPSDIKIEALGLDRVTIL